MTIIDSIKRSQILLQQISTQENVNTEVTKSLSSLQAELNTISSQAQQLIEQLSQLQTSHHSKVTPKLPEMKSGCYIFEGEKEFFCPSCYDNLGNKVATARINKKLRVCPACRSSIK